MKKDDKLSLHEIEEMLDIAAEKGARRTLAKLGINVDDEEAGEDINELRKLLSAYRTAKQTMLKTIIKFITTTALIGLIYSAAIKLKLFGGGH